MGNGDCEGGGGGGRGNVTRNNTLAKYLVATVSVMSTDSSGNWTLAGYQGMNLPINTVSLAAPGSEGYGMRVHTHTQTV